MRGIRYLVGNIRQRDVTNPQPRQRGFPSRGGDSHVHQIRAVGDTHKGGKKGVRRRRSHGTGSPVDSKTQLQRALRTDCLGEGGGKRGLGPLQGNRIERAAGERNRPDHRRLTRRSRFTDLRGERQGHRSGSPVPDTHGDHRATASEAEAVRAGRADFQGCHEISRNFGGEPVSLGGIKTLVVGREHLQWISRAEIATHILVNLRVRSNRRRKRGEVAGKCRVSGTVPKGRKTQQVRAVSHP